MDAHRLGAVVRAVRRRSGRRQRDLAVAAGVSDAAVSRIERGAVGRMRVDTVTRVADALGIQLDWRARWRGAELDRMLNAGHAAMQADVVGLLEGAGWNVAPEVSFSVYGERGVIDLLAYRPDHGVLLVVELKTALVDIPGLLGTVDRYARLAPRIAAERGWQAESASVWLAVADGRTNRRTLARHATLLRAAFPSDGRRLAGWLRRPLPPLRALSFLPDRRRVTARSSGGGATRVRLRRPRSAAASNPADRSPGDASAGSDRPEPT